MQAVLHTLPASSRLLIVRLRSLGDCVLTTPALHLLKTARPDLRLAVMVEARFAAVFAGNPDIETILAPRAGSAMAWRPTLTLNLHGGTRSAVLTAASLAHWRAGFAHYRFQSLYNLPVPRAQEILGEERKVHTAEHVASAMFWLGVPKAEIPRARLFAFEMTQRAARRDRCAVLHPFASAPSKAWPAERFVALAHYLKERHSLEAVIIGGGKDDFAPFADFECYRGAPLSEVKALLSTASLFAGNDSGPAHMAAAFGVPSLVLYGSSDPVVWAPWRTEAETIIEPAGLGGVPLARVREAVDKLRARS
jgi:ADP-heptose:LPS heptosyltransferase